MAYTDQQLKNVILGHLLDFQLSFAKAKIMATNDDINLNYMVWLHINIAILNLRVLYLMESFDLSFLYS